MTRPLTIPIHRRTVYPERSLPLNPTHPRQHLSIPRLSYLHHQQTLLLRTLCNLRATPPTFIKVTSRLMETLTTNNRLPNRIIHSDADSVRIYSPNGHHNLLFPLQITDPFIFDLQLHPTTMLQPLLLTSPTLWGRIYLPMSRISFSFPLKLSSYAPSPATFSPRLSDHPPATLHHRSRS